jgi:hypothetical protein
MTLVYSRRLVVSAAPAFALRLQDINVIFPNTVHLSNELHNTTSLLDLLLSLTADVSGADDEGNFGETALAQDLGVTEREEVDDGGSVGLLAANVGVTLLGGNKGPQLLRYTISFHSIYARLRPVSNSSSMSQCILNHNPSPDSKRRDVAPNSTNVRFQNVPCRG